MRMTTHGPAARLGPGAAGILMSPEEFDSRAAWQWKPGYRYELINGVLIVTPPADIGQSGPNDYLGYELHAYKEHHPQGFSLNLTTHEFPIRTRANRRIVDRVIWAGLGRMADPDQEPPTIVIEFVSPGKRSRTRDYDTKRMEYAEIKVLEYWVIDRFRRQMTVYGNAPSTPAEQVLGEKDVFTTPLLPGFELRLAKLFAINDAIDRARSQRQRE